MIRSAAVRRRLEMMDSVLAMMLPWETMTPRGFPVEPEVNIRAARSADSVFGKLISSAAFAAKYSSIRLKSTIPDEAQSVVSLAMTIAGIWLAAFTALF